MNNLLFLGETLTAVLQLGDGHRFDGIFFVLVRAEDLQDQVTFHRTDFFPFSCKNKSTYLQVAKQDVQLLFQAKNFVFKFCC